ncbi:hypothetical protein BDW22DRAFT_1360728 [Trametopsis cervina]|nr:hypothetical protein BDW22DRAFT_1360728 [Trametopsis cervina]
MSHASLSTLGRVLHRHESLKRHSNVPTSPLSCPAPYAADPALDAEGHPEGTPAEIPPHKRWKCQYGSKLHRFPREEVPWPFAYNREVLEWSLIDAPLVKAVVESPEFVEFQARVFPNGVPTRCLDLGTTLGTWVIDTAKTFPQCTFIGFDLMDVQIDLRYVEPDVAERISWVHGNFLEFPLPFEDDEFDWIHLAGVALAVPEHKWTALFEELHRILKPGGIIEMLQQDAMFPVLPRWFTGPLHEHIEHRTNLRTDSRWSYVPALEVSPEVPHVYVLLEELFNEVFDTRFINRTPSSILPNYFLSVFSKVISPPTLRMPMPPVAPLIPKAWQYQCSQAMSGTTSDPLDPSTYFIPSASSSDTDSLDTLSMRTATSRDNHSMSTTEDTFEESVLRQLHMLKKNSEDGSPRPDLHRSLPPIHTSWNRVSQTQPPTPHARTRTASVRRSAVTGSPRPSERSIFQNALQDATQLGGELAGKLFRTERLMKMGDEVLFMHLHQASRLVFACKEAMWDELEKMVRRKDERLEPHGWRADVDWDIGDSRRRFDGLFEGYRHDIGVRLSFWHSLIKVGWSFPVQNPLTPSEKWQEDMLRQAILEARKDATEEEFNTPTRSIRMLIGVKGQ